ncbi:MAG: ATP-binding cassette domain-containing protein [Acidimicrobiia bacterium]|nr:ATP-binding cassette domain-containing protein [Actinomycetota bacterium]MBL6924596.1 ATP-binding cassette domain-containing protein [Acidimicrobiia bacterium]
MRVIHDLDLVVHAGERLAIMGLNGHGKTTLFRAILGLTDWQTGSILLGGREIGGRRMSAPGRRTHRIAASGVALLPQGDAIFPGLTVEQNVLTGVTSSGTWRRRRGRLDSVLEIFPPLRPLLDMPVGKMSGGERRMVSLARGLMGDNRVFLVDEPSLGLAPKIAAGVIDALGQVELGEGAMVIAEQSIPLLSGRMDRILGMHSGQIKQDAADAFAGISVDH